MRKILQFPSQFEFLVVIQVHNLDNLFVNSLINETIDSNFHSNINTHLTMTQIHRVHNIQIQLTLENYGNLLIRADAW